MQPPRHLYVHVPFCARRCVYCDFSIAVRTRVPVDDYLVALDRELETRIGGGVGLDTVYFGGGTPSKLGAEGVARMMDVVRSHAAIETSAEVTLEANPEDVTTEAVRHWARAGVNRVSLGVQSFQDPVLAWMHRSHDSKTASRSLKVIREGGIGNLSLDLIFATPPEIRRSWLQDVELALAEEPDHVSVYGLTIEPHTPLGRWVARRNTTEAPEEEFEREFSEAAATLNASGFEHYEVSNYSRPGSQSRHNWAYWTRRAYLGVGPSAHEFDGCERRWNVAAYAEWQSRAAAGEDPVEGRERLDRAQEMQEELYLGLRTNAGVQLGDAEKDVIAPWLDAGWATLTGSRLRLTSLGWLRLDALATALTTLRSR